MPAKKQCGSGPATPGSSNVPHKAADTSTSVAPWGVHATSDGFLMIGIANNPQFERLAKACGHPEWAEKEEYKTNTSRLANKAELADEIAQVLRTKTMDEWARVFEGQFAFGRVKQYAAGL
jgi:crotonobetainyl-CoA:carnitine CoA-transferase CaiB-like acyl-CoA transferase